MTGPAASSRDATVTAQMISVISAVSEAASPTTAHSPADAAEIRCITDAMTRLLLGVPLRSDGQLTVKALADEAGLKRNKLTHKHTNLKDLFYALIRAQEHRPQALRALQKQRDVLRNQTARLRRERDSLIAQVQQLVRITQVLELENEQLRQADRRPTLQVLPHQP
ncbi:hypothetical protein ACIQVK_31005 [Streptomyces sp. NPDC090493]|uniref:hypothetical protein n=1 Tax=Streptomyces sp. NPDC090493 TaxID=3365964 RepID=UPI0037F2AF8A